MYKSVQFSLKVPMILFPLAAYEYKPNSMIRISHIQEICVHTCVFKPITCFTFCFYRWDSSYELMQCYQERLYAHGLTVLNETNQGRL